MELSRIYAPVEDDLRALDVLLGEELASDDPFIGELVGHVLGSHGKMIRPALVCLSALACGGGPGDPGRTRHAALRLAPQGAAGHCPAELVRKAGPAVGIGHDVIECLDEVVDLFRSGN